MADYPSSITSLTNPASTDTTTNPSHADQHSNANDEIEAIETELGTDPAGSSATVVARLDAVDTTVALNTAKVTNATHTGDVTGATALTITNDAVDEEHINWGVGASQVSAVDMPIADSGEIITATEVEGALQENRTAIDTLESTVSFGTRDTFDDADLSSGVLTITHNLGLSTPFTLNLTVVDNNQDQIIPDDITFATNTITVDLTSYGTITGTWGYYYA